MKAFRFYEPEVPWKLEEVPTPTIGDNDVLVKIKAAGICVQIFTINMEE